MLFLSTLDKSKKCLLSLLHVDIASNPHQIDGFHPCTHWEGLGRFHIKYV